MKKQPMLLTLAIIGLAHWFFGNVYEQIVLAPNMLVDTYAQLQCWQNYFVVTNQIYYYVPFTQLSVFLIWYLYVKTKDRQLKNTLLKGGIFGLLSIAITVGIVTQLNLKMFFGDLSQVAGDLHTLAVYWILLNGLRIILVGATLVYACKSFLFNQQKAYTSVNS